MSGSAIYILASRRNGTLYTGVTSNPVRRIFQHRDGETAGFVAEYKCSLLVYFEMHQDMAAAIDREKQIKGGSRAKKLVLIEAGNPRWRDLYEAIL